MTTGHTNRLEVVALALLDDIVDKVDGEDEDFDAFYGSDWDYNRP